MLFKLMLCHGRPVFVRDVEAAAVTNLPAFYETPVKPIFSKL